MSSDMALNDAEVRCLRKVAAGGFTNLLNPPDEVELLMLRGLVQSALIMAVPFTPNRYNYCLTIFGEKTLEGLQPDGKPHT